LARQQGYASLPDVYEYNDVFRSLDDPYLYYFVEVLEPALDAYEAKRFGQMYETLSGKRPAIRRIGDKADLAGRLDELLELRRSATVGEVVDYISNGDFPPLSAELERREEKLAAAVANEEELGKTLATSQKLREISYSEIIAFRGFHSQAAPYATKHGVKGAEFDNVLVVVGRGWSNYNFGEMLNRVASSSLEEPRGDQMFVRNRNLFYVSCTRARDRLAVLFTQELSAKAISHLGDWFGESNVIDVAKDMS
jgi:DNA helicase-2/ATP-dependent DNA helicase PcrA